MKSREAIRNKIIHYASIVWNTKRVDHIHPLIHLMIEEISNELYLMDNKLHDIDATILEKLVRNIIPTQFNYVRAAFAIAQVRPGCNRLYVNRKMEFLIKEMPDYLLRKNISSVVFSPATDVVLNNLGISHLFYNRKLWEVDDQGNKKLLGEINARSIGNKLWMLLDNPGGLKRIKEMCFYMDFPHLDDSHAYYQSLSLLKWKAGNVSLKVEGGLPHIAKDAPNRTESETLSYFEIHYQTLTEEVRLDDKSCHSIPGDLASVLGAELTGSLPDGYWISIEFPAHFEAKDIERMQILLNTFPILNRRYVQQRQEAESFTGVMALSSEIGEEFLDLERIEDTNKNAYAFNDTNTKSRQGVYTLDPVKKKDIQDTRLHDYLEWFVDVLERERVVFPGIDKDKIIEIQNAVAALQEDDEQKIDMNVLNEFAEVARLNIHLREDTHALNICYWTTLGEMMNDLPATTQLMASKTIALNKSETTLITPVTGGRVLYDLESIKAISRFYMTSKGRILTKHDILNFCQIEVGKFVRDIDVVRCGKISPKPGEGIVNAMEIRIVPKEKDRDYFRRKDTLRQLRIRLKERSPLHYNYVITIVE